MDARLASPTPRFARIRRSRPVVPVVPVVLLALALACAPQQETAGEGETDDSVAARIGGETITVAELDAEIKEQLFVRATEGGNPGKLYQLRAQHIEDLAARRVLEAAAAERGVSVEAMLEEAAGQQGPVSDEEVSAFYEENEERFGGRGLEEVRESLRAGLANRGRAEKQRAFVTELSQQAELEILLTEPRFEIDPSGPSRGQPDAPVVVVEFSDYQCPFCKRAEPTVKALLERYPEEVLYVYKHFPLDSIHPEARGASEAAVCAEEQGRFWEYHDLLFEKSPAFKSAQLRQYAEQVGLDMEAFDSCLADDRARSRVQQDLAAGRRAGVSGTPAFFVNGRSLSGARPLEAFVEVIDSELEAQASDAGEAS